MSDRREISHDQLTMLRGSGVISENEIAYWAADILVAENVVTSNKRVIKDAAHLLKESSSRTLLKG